MVEKESCSCAALEIEVVEYVINEDKKNCPFAVRFPSKYKPSIVSLREKCYATSLRNVLALVLCCISKCKQWKHPVKIILKINLNKALSNPPPKKRARGIVIQIEVIRDKML